MQFDAFQLKVLRTIVMAFDQLPEREKTVGGVDIRAAAKALVGDFGAEPEFVDSPEYHGSELSLKLYNTFRALKDLRLIKWTEMAGGYGWASPTAQGRSVITRLESPGDLGQHLVRHLYRLQQDSSELERRVGKSARVNPQDFARQLGIEPKTLFRAMRWAQREGFINEADLDQSTLESGDVYITDKGMSAVDSDFQPSGATGGATVNIHGGVYGDVLASGRDAMVIRNQSLAASQDEIRSLLTKVQEVLETLPEDSDDRHDGLQELASIERELAKPAPALDRVERSVNVLGSLASIGAVLLPHASLLLELLNRMPH